MVDRMEAAGAPAAIEPLDDAATWLDRHGDVLYRHARARVGGREQAEDLVQETLLAGLAARESFRGDADVRTWLVSILRRKIADHYRKNGSSAQVDAPAEETSFHRTVIEQHVFDDRGTFRRPPQRWKRKPDPLEVEELRNVLDSCIDHLPRRYAVAFTLREVDDLSQEEVRSRLRLSAGNLRVQLYRARLLLRECLEKNWFAADPTKIPDHS
jgi:RNA polymerase sigma-70 factor (ECF subfamily)